MVGIGILFQSLASQKEHRSPPSWALEVPSLLSKPAKRDAEVDTILWCGGSSARGYPYIPLSSVLFPNKDGSQTESSSARFLQALLEGGVPKFHVRNLGVPGADIQSIWRRIEREMQSPPALIILQTGHNEFLPRNITDPRRWRRRGGNSLLARLYRTFFLCSAQELKRPEVPPEEFWFQRNGDPITTAPYIREDLRRKVISDFRFYLRQISSLCEEKDIPLILLTAASNEEWPPDRSWSKRVGSSKLARFLSRRIGETIRARKTGDRERAWALADDIAKAYPDLSEAYYQRALIRTELGKIKDARLDFKRAVDYSVRLVRAPTEINEVIRAVARERGHSLADIDSLLLNRPTEKSPYEAIVDNLHPSIDGQYLIAKRVYSAMVRRGLVTNTCIEEQSDSGDRRSNLHKERLEIPDRLIAQGLYFSARLHYIFSLHRQYDSEYLLGMGTKLAEAAREVDSLYFGPTFFLSVLEFEKGNEEAGSYYLDLAQEISKVQLEESVGALASFENRTGYILTPNFMMHVRGATE